MVHHIKRDHWAQEDARNENWREDLPKVDPGKEKKAFQILHDKAKEKFNKKSEIIREVLNMYRMYLELSALLKGGRIHDKMREEGNRLSADGHDAEEASYLAVKKNRHLIERLIERLIGRK